VGPDGGSRAASDAQLAHRLVLGERDAWIGIALETAPIPRPRACDVAQSASQEIQRD